MNFVRTMSYLIFLFSVAACSSSNSTLEATARSYVVSVSGSDTNPGSSGQPFRTIQKCASTAVASETCLIRAGTYRETIQPNSGVTFQPEGNALVTVDGSNPVTGWTRQSGNVYRATVNLPVTGNRDTGFLANQVFVAGQMMREASYPNPSSNLLRPNWALMGAGTTPQTINDTKLPNYDWAGATIRLYSGDNAYVNLTGTVTASPSSRIDFDAFNLCPFFCPTRGGRYFLVGGSDIRAVDAATEWLYKDGILYFYPPNGVDPNTLNVTAKRRNYAFDLRGKSNVTIKNLKIFASTVITDAASSNNVLDGIEASYISHYNTLPLPNPSELAYDEGAFNIVASHTLDSGIILNGTGNVLKNSKVAFSAGNGVLLRGSGNRLENNLIHDAGYTTSYATTVNVTGSNQVVTKNTIYNAGRDGITVDWHINGKTFANNDISYNNVYQTNLLSPDGGGIYTCCFLNAQGSSIHHNWIHDQQVVGGYNPTKSIAGLYMDNRSEGFNVYQNVFWNNVNFGLILNGNNDSQNPGNKINRNSTVRNNTFLGNTGRSINLRDIDDATGSSVIDNLITNGLIKQNSLFNFGEEVGNSVTVPGATQGYSAKAGCNFAGCGSTKPPLPSQTPYNALYTVQAEIFNEQSGGVARNSFDIGSLDNGDWVKYSGLDFGAGVSKFIARVGVDAAFAGQKLELRLDSPSGALIGTLTVASTNGFETYTSQVTPVSGVTGIHDLFLVPKGGAGIANIDLFWFRR
jgi:Carbohydrate binding module (family 6)/Right handed beta helix region/Protein of unknown function (DUF1565)